MSWTDNINTKPITHSSPSICTSDVSLLETLEIAHIFNMDHNDLDNQQSDVLLNWAKKRTTKDADWREVIKQERNKLGAKNGLNDLYVHVRIADSFENIKKL